MRRIGSDLLGLPEWSWHFVFLRPLVWYSDGFSQQSSPLFLRLCHAFAALRFNSNGCGGSPRNAGFTY